MSTDLKISLTDLGKKSFFDKQYYYINLADDLTTSNIFCQKIENLYNWMDNLWQQVENIVAKALLLIGVIFFEHFYLG